MIIFDFKSFFRERKLTAHNFLFTLFTLSPLLKSIWSKRGYETVFLMTCIMFKLNLY